MMKHFTLFAAALSFVPAAVQAGEPERAVFEYDGARYVYTVIATGSGRTIKGWEEIGKTPFTLHVGKSRVTGNFGVTQVSFSLKDVKPLKGTVEVALK